MGRAVSEMIAREIGGHSTDVITASALHANALAQARPITAPGESAEREAAIADGATRIVMGQISLSRNQLMLDITERDAAAGTNIESFTLTSVRFAGAFYALADAAARKLSPRVTAFDSKSGPAISSWARALEQTDFAKANAEYASAVQADPTFAEAWFAWARSASTHGERGEAERILSEAQQHANGFSELNRSRLKLSRLWNSPEIERPRSPPSRTSTGCFRRRRRHHGPRHRRSGLRDLATISRCRTRLSPVDTAQSLSTRRPGTSSATR